MGRPPTVVEELLDESAAELAPHKSLAAIETSAKFLLASVAVVGTLLTGLGIVTSTQLATTSAAWALPSVVCVAVSLALAASALVPARSTVTLADREDVQRFYDGQLSRRGRLMIVAGWLFALSIPLATLPALEGTLHHPAPKLRMSARLTGRATDARVMVSVGAERMSADGRIYTTVEARDRDGTSRRLARDIAAPNASGAATSQFEVAPGASSVALTVRSSLVLPGKRDSGRAIVLDIPQ